MGGSEIIVILIVALLFLGPDKLPQAAKQISKGIRDIKKQSRALQQQIENDDQIGGALRDIKSALRGDEAPVRPKPAKRPKPLAPVEDAAPAALAAATAADGESAPDGNELEPAEHAAANAAEVAAPEADLTEAQTDVQTSNAPPVRLPPTAGEPDPDVPADADDDEDLAKMIRPAEGTVAKGSEPKHG